MQTKHHRIMTISAVGGLLVMLIVVVGSIWMGRSARQDTEQAVVTVSLFYLDELAGRREQVVEDNLNQNIQLIHTAIDLLTEDDLRDEAHLREYQSRMKSLFRLKRFAFVDREGLVYTASGTMTDIGQYQFDCQTITGPEISIKNESSCHRRAGGLHPV